MGISRKLIVSSISAALSCHALINAANATITSVASHDESLEALRKKDMKRQRRKMERIASSRYKQW